MRVLVFGDSITQGYWDTDGGWVERIRKHYDEIQITDLNERDDPTFFNLGISADNSANILARIEAETIARTRHGNLPVIILQIGVNDSSKDLSGNGESVSLSIEQYEKNLHAIINKVRPISSKIIFIGFSACDESRTTPVAWGDFHYTNDDIKDYEDVLKYVAERDNIPFISVFDRFLEQLNNGKHFLIDGLHPNNDGHEFMSRLIQNELDSLLR